MTDTTTKINIFIAYAREDAAYLKELRKQLRILERSGQVDKIWYDGEIAAGQEWEKAIKNAMKTADIFLLLLSADFINSDYCYGVEMEEALARHEAGTSTIIPIVLRDCAWQLTPLYKIQAPLDGQSIVDSSNKDKSYKIIVESILDIIDEKDLTTNSIKIKENIVKLAQLKNVPTKLFTYILDRISPKAYVIPEMIFVKGGLFQMGCADEQNKIEEYSIFNRARKLIVDDFFIGKYTITRKEFCFYLESLYEQTYGNIDWITDYEFRRYNKIIPKQGKFIVEEGYESYPIIYTDWFLATLYASWLSKKTGNKYRLPTEVEWEYAARGGKKTKDYRYAGSNEIKKVACYDESSIKETGNKLSNELGIHDMSGNVWEWCDYLKKRIKKDDMNTGDNETSELKIARGGAWNSLDYQCSNTYKSKFGVGCRNKDLGFRLVCTKT